MTRKVCMQSMSRPIGELINNMEDAERFVAAQLVSPMFLSDEMLIAQSKQPEVVWDDLAKDSETSPEIKCCRLISRAFGSYALGLWELDKDLLYDSLFELVQVGYGERTVSEQMLKSNIFNMKTAWKLIRDMYSIYPVRYCSLFSNEIVISVPDPENINGHRPDLHFLIDWTENDLVYVSQYNFLGDFSSESYRDSSYLDDTELSKILSRHILHV